MQLGKDAIKGRLWRSCGKRGFASENQEKTTRVLSERNESVSPTTFFPPCANNC